MPGEWRDSVLISIYKNKGDLHSCNNKIGITYCFNYHFINYQNVMLHAQLYFLFVFEAPNLIFLFGVNNVLVLVLVDQSHHEAKLERLIERR